MFYSPMTKNRFVIDSPGNKEESIKTIFSYFMSYTEER